MKDQVYRWLVRLGPAAFLVWVSAAGGCVCGRYVNMMDSGTIGENCVDLVDNDLDGATDCDDAECLLDPACAGANEICGNGIDDDSDGDTDCDDSECFGVGGCADPCLVDPTLPKCSKPPPGADFGVGGNSGCTPGSNCIDGWYMDPAPACDPTSPFYIAPPPSFMGSSTVITGGAGLYSGMVVGGSLSKINVSFLELAGYYEVPLTGTSFTFTVSFSQSLALTMVTMQLIPFGIEGEVGQCFLFPITILQVGGGDLQISLVFDMPDDIDLHVIEPGGFEIYYGATMSTTGGNLDLDSNPACAQDFVNNENVTWCTGGVCSPIPVGMYTVRVDNWEDCAFGSGPTSYVVTVTKDGVATTYPGSFADGTDDAGGAGSGVTVATFSYP